VPNFGIALEWDSQSARHGTIHSGFVHRMGKIEKNARDFTPAFKKIRKSFYAAEVQKFNSLGGGHWQPDTAATLRRKAERGQDPRVMRATGELYLAMTRGQGPGAVNKLTTDELALGTRLVQGVVAQRTKGRKRRRFLVGNKRRRMAWMKTIRDHITNASGSS
jgi:hypothetical protein